MMAGTRSIGILLYRVTRSGVEVFLGHMGGPYWSAKDAGAWSIPKGEPVPGESDLATALREFGEEIGRPAPELDYRVLGEFRQASGKLVTVFTATTDEEVAFVASNDFELEWPPHSGRIGRFPELDRAEWVGLVAASELVVKGQRAMLAALGGTLSETHSGERGSSDLR